MVLSEWVLGLLIASQSMHPHRATYERTSDAIARAATASPLFAGEHGDAKTAALLVSVSWFESGHKPDAEGDCTGPVGSSFVRSAFDCKKPGAVPHSFCLLQINETNFSGFGITRDQVQTDIDVCVTTGLKMMHQSFSVCRALPLEDRLRWYAGGGSGCPTNEDATRKSRHRVAKGLWLFKVNAPTW